MSDTERADLKERILKIEVMFDAHEKGAIDRKAELAKTLDSITLKLDSHQCAAHSINMLTLKHQYLEIKEKDLPAIYGRLTLIERCLWMGLGALGVLEIALRIFGK